MTPPIPQVITDSHQAWKLLETDYTLRLSLVANEWAREHLRTWNAVFAEGRRRGNAGYYGPALVEMEIADGDKRAEWSYQTCCEIWEIQGRTKRRPFFRAIFDWCLQPMFSTREGCFRHGLEIHQKRAGARISQDFSGTYGHFKREMGKLRAKWNTKLEIATRDAEHQERLSRELEARQALTIAQSAGERRSEAMGTALEAQAGAVSSTFTWKELEIRFRQIQAPPTMQNASATFIPTESEWIVGGNAAWRKQFEHLASIASRKLGCTASEGVS